MQAQRFLEGLTHQSNLLGRWWGNIQLVAQHANIYVQFLILGFSGTAAYGVLSAMLLGNGRTLEYWQFVLIVTIPLGLLALFVWRLQIPSSFSSWNHLWWSHDNPLHKRLDKRDKEIDERLDRIESMLQELIQEKNESHRIDEVYSQKG